MSVIADLPDLRPSLLLDFANSRRVDPRISCVRASAATCWGPDGRPRTVAANVPRIDYDPHTGKCLGYLSERGSTNKLLHSKTFGQIGSGWSVGSNSTTGIGVGAPDGGTYTIIKNTQTGNAYISLQRTVQPQEIETASVFWRGTVKPEAGHLLLIDHRYADGSLKRTTLPFSSPEIIADGKWRRYSLTAQNLSLETVVEAVYVGADTGLFDVEAWGPQIETGIYATSYISTEDSAVTRASDFSFVRNAEWADDFTIVFECTKTDVVGAFPRYVALSTGNYAHELFVAEGGSGQLILGSTEQGVVASSAFPVSTASGQAFKAAMSYSAATQRLMCVVNGVYATHFTARGFAITELGILSGPGGSDVATGNVRRVAVYQCALTDAQMGRLTA